MPRLSNDFKQAIVEIPVRELIKLVKQAAAPPSFSMFSPFDVHKTDNNTTGWNTQGIQIIHL